MNSSENLKKIRECREQAEEWSDLPEPEKNKPTSEQQKVLDTYNELTKPYDAPPHLNPFSLKRR